MRAKTLYALFIAVSLPPRTIEGNFTEVARLEVKLEPYYFIEEVVFPKNKKHAIYIYRIVRTHRVKIYV